ncbi:hypothetical protein V3C10_07125 [[Clostridium] symbiosum]|uniref:hypothetical protein n=1 Tax=Clostridium symbiosum TaxID=1512 RepID=UPI001D067DFD|nr:hypothetical protein [[Clostridium] symbiosum]MCB6607144.1 hypothetical protein [[Clostridium] symbiosum]MCB6929704.1 hypothetical protein [[Clostridium] symbiosum]
MEPNEILEQAIRELTETALQNRREAADTAEKELLSEEVDLSIKVQSILQELPNEKRDTINQYIETKELVADHDCKYLYIQGAKDCVKLLKELGAF